MPGDSGADRRDLGRAERGAFPGEERRLCLAYLPDLAVGDYTIAHAGFALTRVDEAVARQTVATMTEYGVFGDQAEART